MDTRSPRGTALLIAGHVVDATGQRASSVVQILGRVGEILLSAGAGWRVTRLDPGGSRHTVPTRDNTERELRALQGDGSEVALIVATGSIATASDGEPVLIGDPRWVESASPTAATIPLAGLRARPGTSRLAIVLGGWPIGSDGSSDPAARWLEALSQGRAGDLVVAGAGERALATIETLYAGIAGSAVDASTGTVTLRSLGEYLARGVPGLAIRSSLLTETLVTPRPLAGIWDTRLTRRSRRADVDLVARPSEPNDLRGTTLPGRFRIDAEVARGGFGTVYRAKQLTVDRDVAVKVLHAGVEPASPSGRLFVHEIQSVGRIDHPNVVRIYHADVTSEGQLFFAMELLAGQDLEQVIQAEGRLAQDRAVGLVRQLLAGLGAAHDADLVHADIKPANILIVPARSGERVVLVDFGLSRLRTPDAPARSVGGTPAYMAPEQLRNGRVDARSDLFAAALVLVTLLTGWRRRAKDELAPPLDDIGDAGLRDTLRRALSIDPADRFQTAAELAAALSGAPAIAPAHHGPDTAASVHVDVGGDRVYGRDREIDELLDAVLYRHAVILAGRPGIGKTSLVRHGLIPRIAAVGARTLYAADRPGAAAALARAIDPGAAGITDALARWHARDTGKLVIVIDQLDAALIAPARASDVGILDMLAIDRWPAGVDLAVVACVRDDAIAAARAGGLGPDVPVVLLDGLDDDGAREAILAPLAERRIAMDPALVAALLHDLRRAAAAHGPAGEVSLHGCYPPHLRRICTLLNDALRDDEARLTLAHYERIGGAEAIGSAQLVPIAARSRTGDRAVRVAGAAIAGIAVAAAALWYRASSSVTPVAPEVASPSPAMIAAPAGPASSAVLPSAAPASSPTVVVGGSGTLLWGFFAPLNAFLEEAAEVTLPITSQNDLGSGGALDALRTGALDIAALSRRHKDATPVDPRAAGKLLVEVAVGFDETSLFVWRGNPLRTIDLGAVRAHLCCRPGADVQPLTWKDFGLVAAPFAAQPVTWLVFGRKRHPGPRETTSATLALADEWFCAPDWLCSSSIQFDVQANDVLPALVKDASSLALSSRSFATDQVAAVALVDRAHHTRLDGRKVLWIYALVDADKPVPAKLCRFFGAVLHPAVASRLAATGKATGLADPLRQRQRDALGLDDHTCERQPASALAERAGGAAGDGRLASPIAGDVEVTTRWIPDR